MADIINNAHQVIRYTAEELLYLRDSPLCIKPPDLPDLGTIIGPTNSAPKDDIKRARHYEKSEEGDGSSPRTFGNFPKSGPRSTQLGTSSKNIVLGPPKMSFASSQANKSNESIEPPSSPPRPLKLAELGAALKANAAARLDNEKLSKENTDTRQNNISNNNHNSSSSSIQKSLVDSLSKENNNMKTNSGGFSLAQQGGYRERAPVDGNTRNSSINKYSNSSFSSNQNRDRDRDRRTNTTRENNPEWLDYRPEISQSGSTDISLDDIQKFRARMRNMEKKNNSGTDKGFGSNKSLSDSESSLNKSSSITSITTTTATTTTATATSSVLENVDEFFGPRGSFITNLNLDKDLHESRLDRLISPDQHSPIVDTFSLQISDNVSSTTSKPSSSLKQSRFQKFFDMKESDSNVESPPITTGILSTSYHSQNNLFFDSTKSPSSADSTIDFSKQYSPRSVGDSSSLLSNQNENQNPNITFSSNSIQLANSQKHISFPTTSSYVSTPSIQTSHWNESNKSSRGPPSSSSYNINQSHELRKASWDNNLSVLSGTSNNLSEQSRLHQQQQQQQVPPVPQQQQSMGRSQDSYPLLTTSNSSSDQDEAGMGRIMAMLARSSLAASAKSNSTENLRNNPPGPIVINNPYVSQGQFHPQVSSSPHTTQIPFSTSSSELQNSILRPSPQSLSLYPNNNPNMSSTEQSGRRSYEALLSMTSSGTDQSRDDPSSQLTALVQNSIAAKRTGLSVSDLFGNPSNVGSLSGSKPMRVDPPSPYMQMTQPQMQMMNMGRPGMDMMGGVPGYLPNQPPFMGANSIPHHIQQQLQQQQQQPTQQQNYMQSLPSPQSQIPSSYGPPLPIPNNMNNMNNLMRPPFMMTHGPPPNIRPQQGPPPPPYGMSLPMNIMGTGGMYPHPSSSSRPIEMDRKGL